MSLVKLDDVYIDLDCIEAVHVGSVTLSIIMKSKYSFDVITNGPSGESLLKWLEFKAEKSLKESSTLRDCFEEENELSEESVK